MSEISELIEQNLRLLEAYVNNEDRGIIPGDVVREIGKLVSQYSQGLSDREIDFACSLIFNGQFGILTFLEKTTGSRDSDNLRDARKAALEILCFIFEHFGRRCLEYAVRAKEISLSMLHRDHFADVKSMGLIAVSKILVACVGTINVEKLDLPGMVNKLFMQLAQASKLTPTVKNEILCLLGHMAQKYPECMQEYSDRLKNLYLSELKLMNSKTKKLDRAIIAGCFYGLNGYLHNFTVSFEEDADLSYQIFSYVRQAVNPDVEHTRYEMMKAAMMLLANHAPQFSLFICDDHEEIYNYIVSWTRHRNPELTQVAYKALEACLKVIAEQLPHRHDSSRILQFFMVRFKERMQNSSYIRDVAVALRGYGVFAAECKLEQSECEAILFDILLRAEHLCMSDGVLETKVQFLPSFIDALASLLKEVKTPLESHMLILEKLVIFQIEFFPYLPRNQSFYCYSSLSRLFLIMSAKENVFRNFLSKVVYQGLIRVFSHPNVTEVELKEEERKDIMSKLSPHTISYKNYIDLWEGLLLLSNAEKGSTLADREALVVAVYDTIISSVLEIIGKLDLVAKKVDELASEEGNNSSDPVLNLQPATPKDFRVLVNLVDFCKDLLLKRQVHHFEKWIFTFGMHMIRQSTKLPYVSGFYKLVTVCLKLCSKLKYFEDGMTISSEKQTSFTLFFRFAKETVVLLRQYKEDLLVSCLQVILALPAPIISAHLETFVPAIQRSFTLGLTYHPLAEEALVSLQLWCSVLPVETISPYFTDILPHLVKFLYASTDHEKSLELEVSVLRNKSERGRQKIPLKVFKQDRKNIKFEESKMTQLQLKILTFLGSLGNQYNAAALSMQNEEISHAAVSWDVTCDHHLIFPLPFNDLKPQITFDEFLPRIVDLALMSSDRQTKIAACELLHALVIYMIGKGSQDALLQNRKPADKIFKHLFSALVRLSCDADQVTKELFEPLTFQLIHWFTHKKIIISEETAVLMDFIWQGITEPEDTALRDLCAKCMREFVKWSIKQSTPKELEEKGFSIKAILRRLYNFCLHPNPYKRLGAALAFNSIYDIYREEEALVKTFTLEVLVHLVDNLTLAHLDNESFGTHYQCKVAIDHVERILREKKNIFLKHQKATRVPSCLEDGSLSSVVLWLLEGCGCRQTESRHKKMELIIKLSPCFADDARSYFQKLLRENGADYYRHWFEKSIRDPLQQLGGNVFTIKFIKSWMENVLASLDCYTWVFSQNLLLPSDIFGKHTVKFGFFEALEFFLVNLASGGLEEAAKFFSQNSSDYFFMPLEHTEYNRLKCTVIVRLLNFLSTVFSLSNSDKYLSSLCSENMWKCLSLVILDPSSLGFDVTDIEISTHLPEEITCILQALKTSNFLHVFVKNIHKQIELNPSLDLNHHISLSLMELSLPYVQISSLISGYCKLAVADIWPFTESTQLCSILLESVFCSRVLDLSPLSQALGRNILQLVFSLNLKPIILVTKILETEHGIHVFNVFRSTIAAYMASNANDVIPLLIESISSDVAQTVLLETVVYVSRNKQLLKSMGSKVLNATLECLSHVTDWWTKTENGSGFILSLLAKMVRIDTSVVNRKEPVDVCKKYLQLLSTSAKLGVIKGQVLDLFIYFMNESEEMKFKLKDVLEQFSTLNFPLRSNEFPSGSPQSNDYIAALRKLIGCLESSGNQDLFEFLIDIFVREDKHIYLKEFQSCLQRLLKSQPIGKHLQLIEVPYNMLCNAHFPSQTLSNITNLVLIPLLRSVSSPIRVTFFTKHIVAIIDVLKEKLPKAPDWKVQLSLTAKIGAFQLIEVLYSCLPRDVVHSKESAINSAYCSGAVQTGKEMTKEVTSLAHAAKKEDIRGQSLHLELRRQYHCSAYNAAIAVIASTQTELKFYTAFLFNDNPLKGEFLWENIVDCNRNYIFEIELDAPLERKKKLISVHQDSVGVVSDSNVKYLSSQYLADSSLSEDLSQFDFSASQQQSIVQGNPEKNSVMNNGIENEYVELEDDELNQHECMGTLTSLLKQMVDKKIIPQEGNDLECPKFLENIKKKLDDNSTPNNVKLFLLRIIVNNSEILKPFAKHLVNTMLNMIISGVCSATLNYFILDVLYTIFSWSTEAQENDRDNYSAVLKFMIKNSPHPRKAIFRNNTEIIKLMVETWKPFLEIPYSLIYELINKEKDKSKKENAYGIHILGVILANNMAPYDNPNKKSLLLSVVPNISNKYKEVYAVTAEVCGMILKYMSENLGGLDENFEKALEKELSGLGDFQKGQQIICVNKICFRYPPFASRFLKKFLFMLPTIYGPYPPKILEVVHARADEVEGGFRELKTLKFLSMLENGVEEVQLLCLKIILKLLGKLNIDDLLTVLPIVKKKQLHPSNACRHAMYEIFMAVYDKFRISDGAKAKEVTQLAKDTLLLGLMDPEEALKLTVSNFWSSESHLPASTAPRLAAVLADMYSPASESQFLQYATFLVLEQSSRSPDFIRKIFDRPLSNCHFKNYSVSASWRQRHAAMTPLFADTQSLGVMASSMSLPVESFSAGVRATQEAPQFRPTQDQRQSYTYNWLTQSSVDSHMSWQSLDFSEGSSLLINLESDKSTVRRKERDETDSSSAKSNIPNDVKHIRRRFVKETEKTRGFYAKREKKLSERREEQAKIRQASRDAHVTMYRQYRIGELPDIEIPHSAIITPLQALAQRDAKIAQMLMRSLTNAVIEEVKVRKPQGYSTYCRDICSALNNILQQSNSYCSTVIAFALEVMYKQILNVDLNPEDVSTASQASNHQNLGILVLESYLNHSIDAEQETPAKKKARKAIKEPSQNVTVWIKLAELYRSCNNYDVVHGVFSQSSDLHPETVNALVLEARGDYKSALKKFIGLYEDQSETKGMDQAEIDLWDDAIMECYLQLTKWDSLQETVLNRVSGAQQNLWQDSFYQEHYLPYFIHSSLKLMMEEQGGNTLVKFIEDAITTKERRMIIESRFAIELTVLYILCGDYNRARYYSSSSLRQFLQDWTSISILNTRIQQRKLQDLQELIEAHQSLNFMANNENFSDTKPLRRMLGKWLHHLPSFLNEAFTWDTITSNRGLYIQKILEKLQSSGCDIGEIKIIVDQHLVQMKLACVSSACSQGNLPVALKHLKWIQKKAQGNEEKVSCIHAYSRTQQQLSLQMNPNEKLKVLIHVHEQLDKIAQCTSSAGSSVTIEHKLLLSETFQMLAETCSSIDMYPEEELEKLKRLINCSHSTLLVSTLSDKSYEYLLEATAINVDKKEVYCNAQMKLASFCNQHLLKLEEDTEKEQRPTLISQYPRAFVCAVLETMRSGKASYLFPRILQIVETHPECFDIFIQKSGNVPCWMFLYWINQILVLLDKPCAKAVQPIVECIARTYENALVYPFMLSMEEFSFCKNDGNKAFVNRINDHLNQKLPVIEEFVTALKYLGVPHRLFKEAMEGITSAKLQNESTAKVLQMYSKMWTELFDSNLSSPVSGSKPRERGLFFANFAKTYASLLEDQFGSEGTRISSMPPKEFHELYLIIQNKMNVDADKATRSGKLKLSDLSSWLSGFHLVKSEQKLEIPGQYSGRSKPIPEHHVKISGFDQTVLVLQSLAKPRRLTIRGEDEKEYHFLVKAGEDLRQDNRIEHLFGVMNEIYHQDAACAARHLHLVTYKVIPLTTRIGLIEWVNNTKVLKDFIVNGANENERKQLQQISAIHMKWILEKNNGKSLGSQYSNMYQGKKREDTVKKYQQKVALLPWDLLRRSFLLMCASPEAFLTLREQFVTSHAVLSISQWLLGIGDRHLSNFLVCMNTGSELGIDFGHAFGSATQFLQVPELMPFRLTPQYINLMLPLKEKGLIEATMVHTLAALRKNHNVLLTMMDIFIKEPTLDWQNFAKKQQAAGMATEEFKEDTKWYPKQRILFARKKLEGINPCCITKEELLLGHSKKEAVKDFIAVCMGERQHNIRATLPENALTVEEQVQCLIDQATDPNILGRAYTGWESWI